MALIRGTTCDFPCPKCLVPKEELQKGRVYAVRTTQTMKEVYEDACGMRTVAERQKYLQGYGLRSISVCAMLALLNTPSHHKTGLTECLLGT